MSTQNFDVNEIDKKIHLLTFGYIRVYVSNKYNDIEIPKNIILLCACFANVYIDSKILKDYSEINTFIELISNQLADKNITESNLEFIYRSSRDGTDGKSFWNKCKLMKNKSIFILIHNINDHKFGCYLSIGLRNDVLQWTVDRKCFIYQVKPNKFIYKHDKNNTSTICYADNNERILWLGDCMAAINIQENFTGSSSCQSDRTCYTFSDLNVKDLVGGEASSGIGSNNIYYWGIVEMEVFELKQS